MSDLPSYTPAQFLAMKREQIADGNVPGVARSFGMLGYSPQLSRWIAWQTLPLRVE
jgi:hypothetical protein